MPHQILDRCHLKEDVTVQFLTLQQDVIHHCHGDGVRIGVAFLRYAGIAAVYIIYRYRGDGGQ